MTKKSKFTFVSLIKDVTFSSNMISLNNSFELLALFKTYGFRVLNSIGSKSRGYRTRLNFMLKFFKFLLYLRRSHSSEFVVAYLKAGQLAIQKKVANNPVESLREINPDYPLPRLVNGFPHVIPVSDRRLMTSGVPSVIRF